METTSIAVSPGRSIRNAPHSASAIAIVRIAGRAGLLYLLVALVPSAPLEQARRMGRLLTAPAPEFVAVPVDGMRLAGLRDSWGAPRSGGRRHEGIDLFAARGTRVVSATEGIVWRIGEDPLGGRVVWVLGPAGQMHYYAHLDRQAGRRVGDLVGVGDTLGTVGTTGNARGGPPHLHYGIYAAGAGAIDPFPLLVSAAARRSAAPPPTRDAAALRPAAPSARVRTEPRSAS